MLQEVKPQLSELHVGVTIDKIPEAVKANKSIKIQKGDLELEVPKDQEYYFLTKLLLTRLWVQDNQGSAICNYMNNIQQLFFQLIRVALSTQDTLMRPPSAKEWQQLYEMAKKQSLVGICFAGAQKLVDSEVEDYCGMPEMLYLTWMGMAAKIQQKNEHMNESTKEALAFFRSKGFACHVLKGQGIATLYKWGGLKGLNRSSGFDLSGLRQSGDIDVWLTGGREKVYQLSREVLGKITGANYHHIHFPMWEDPEIEAHIYPSFLSSPYRNWQLHKFCKLYEPHDGCGDFPSTEFNLVFIMLHCYRHLCGHGVGMRQVMDYYFVLRTVSAGSRAETLSWCKKLGMGRFVGAMMWVMKEVFGLEDEYLLCEPDEKEGKFLLNEIMNTGNMGHGETRFQWGQKSPLGRFVAAQKRNLHLATHYPHEVLWSPVFNIWRFLWLKTKGL